MDTKLVNLEWNNDTALFPGIRSTTVKEGDLPWRSVSEIIPGIFLTCEQELANRMVSLEKGIVLIINLCAEPHVAPYKVYEYPEGSNVPKYRKIKGVNEFVQELDEYSSTLAPFAVKNRKVYLCNIAALDAPNYELDRHFPETSALIELVMTNRVKLVVKEKDPCRVPSVGVHCMVGVSRSASVVIAYLMKATGVGRDDALSFVQASRPVVNPNPGFQQQLLLWEATDSKRIFDDFSAEMVANEVRHKKNVVEYVQRQLPAILKYNKCAGERQFFGYVVGRGIDSVNAEEEAAAVYREVRSYITAAVDNEVYADTPNFFGYVGEVFNSMQRYSPALLFKASPEADECGQVWGDAPYYRIVKDVGRSGFVKDTCDTVRAFCSLLEAIHVKQLAETPLRLMHRPSGESHDVPAPPCVALSFPFSTFMAPYTEGFVQFSELNALEEQYPTQGGSAMSEEQVHEVASMVAEVFLSAFLVSTTGVCSPRIPHDEEGHVSEGRGSDPNERWGCTSRLLFLRSDIEVTVFELLASSDNAAAVSASDVLAVCAECSEELVALAAARKVAAGILTFRLILETAGHFVHDAYGGRIGADTPVCQGDSRFPVARVQDLLEAVGSSFADKFGKPCDLFQYFRAELEPLVQSGVMHTDGVWSLLKRV